jgi:GNAT superfamily N-acetyltransferase
VVARLFVAPSARRGGVARRLLDAAAGECRRLDRHPVLDVATHFAPAIALYERSGWRHAGRVVVDVGDGRRFEEHVYLAP